MVIKFKSWMNELYQEGKFGNKLRTWSASSWFDEILAHPYIIRKNITYVLRYLDLNGGGMNLPKYGSQLLMQDAIDTIRLWLREGAKLDRITVNESAPDDQLLIQGEICEEITADPKVHGGTPQVLQLRYSIEKAGMRTALATSSIYVSGLAAKVTLQHFLDPDSYEDICILLEQYPWHTIEFGTYSCDLGLLPHRNTVIWEVRRY